MEEPAPSGDANSRLRALVRGRVQGVMFRDFTQAHARSLGLVGWARNLSDGRTVEVVAEGPRSALEALVTRLHEGPRLAHVERVDSEMQAPRGGLDSFGVE